MTVDSRNLHSNVDYSNKFRSINSKTSRLKTVYSHWQWRIHLLPSPYSCLQAGSDSQAKKNLNDIWWLQLNTDKITSGDVKQVLNLKVRYWRDNQWEQRISSVDIWPAGKYISWSPRQQELGISACNQLAASKHQRRYFGAFMEMSICLWARFYMF